MKGVVLAGGLGMRLQPMTKVVNKHLLDVFDEPMIFYPLRTLARAGVFDVTVVTGKEIDQFRSLLGDGSSLGLRLSYAQQLGEFGIADALAQAETETRGNPLVVILGDNIFQDDLSDYVSAFRRQGPGAKLLLKRVALEDAKRFGVATVEDERITVITEKPERPQSDLAVTGCYMYDETVFDVIKGLKPSGRGELEIADVSNHYVRAGTASFEILNGWWTDAGTPASKLKASILVSLSKGVTFNA